jgi:glutathione S-transferase
MTQDRHVTLHFAPHSRASTIRLLLEELKADYDLHIINLQKQEQYRPEYLAINPMGKVPALQHGDALVTEQGAIVLYLSDLYADRGLTPTIGDPQRGEFLRWLFFYGSCFEPAVMDRYLKHEPAPRGTSPYGSFELVMERLEERLSRGPYMLGERFTSLDILWGSAFRWTVGFGLVPPTPNIAAYLERHNARPLVVELAAKDAALAAEQNPPA